MDASAEAVGLALEVVGRLAASAQVQVEAPVLDWVQVAAALETYWAEVWEEVRREVVAPTAITALVALEAASEVVFLVAPEA